jgi:hypothetical protein
MPMLPTHISHAIMRIHRDLGVVLEQLPSR